MPLLETKGAASAQGFGEFAKVGAVNYIEDVFQTWLYTGNSTTGGSQTITNNVDLSTKGGLVWIKGRSAASNHILTDTTRGAGVSASNNNALASNLTSAEDLGASYDYLSAFSTTGFTVTQGGTTTATRGTNYDSVTYASWTFRKQPKFFDVVTYTGDGTASRQIAHSLGSVPGCIIVKSTDNANGASQNWQVWHTSQTGKIGLLNTTDEFFTAPNFGTPTSTYFVTATSGTNNNVNGTNYVAYLFAHDAGGFGLTGTDNVISCGSYTGNGSTSGPSITLGYEPQWIMIKNASFTGNWNIIDNMRGMPVGSADSFLEANTTDAEATADWVSPTATGFNIVSTSSEVNTNTSTYIYIAIRRGPMKVPTDATKVYKGITRTGTGANAAVTGVDFPPDAWLAQDKSGNPAVWYSKLVGAKIFLNSSSTAAQQAGYTDNLTSFDQAGVSLGSDAGQGYINFSGNPYINWALRRAPGFFDVVCYTGNNTTDRTVNHNLGVAPELMIVKARTNTGFAPGNDWNVVNFGIKGTYYSEGILNSTASMDTTGVRLNVTVAPTSTTVAITGPDYSYGNYSPNTYVCYLFATCPGVSKVGTYTGTGNTKQIDCGFTGGARFVLIKRINSSGDWYVWDSARGIVAGNDPYLLLNSTAAEVTNTDWVDTHNPGFELSNAVGNNVNINTATYLFLAIA